MRCPIRFWRRRTSSPIRFNGLSLYLANKVSYAFIVSRAQSLTLQDHILRDNDICGIDSDYLCPLVRLYDTILEFNCSIFTNKDTAP